MNVQRYDTVDRIISNIIIPIAREDVYYKGKRFSPKKVRVSPSIFKSLECPVSCGGCCWKSVTLDWFPHEQALPHATERVVEVNHKEYTVKSIIAEDTEKPCSLLDQYGRCTVYAQRPFLCGFSFIRFMDKKTHFTLMNSTPSRGFHLKRVDGGKGSICYMKEDANIIPYRLEQFHSLKQIAKYLEIETCIDQIIEHISKGITDKPLDIDV